jgi:CheY-like chemotaxis protein
LRDAPFTANVPIVIISADATPAQLDRLLAAGAYACFTKPIDGQRFAAATDGALNSPAKCDD